MTLSYEYDAIGGLTSERLQHGTLDWLIRHTYTANGDVAGLIWPDGGSVGFAPNALGQATQAGVFASGATYYPNGALKQFTYGNGLVHTLTQNLRGLPEQSRDAYGSAAVLDDTYDFDANGNVAAITDGLPGALGDRDMAYDGLDRLVGVTAGAAQGGDAAFAYDPLDNLRVMDQGARQHRYSYDPISNRLTAIRNPAGATLFTIAHDFRGNQTARTGATYTWNRADRLTAASAGNSSYVYDGRGRRVRATAAGVATDSYYGSAGQLLYQQSPARAVNYVYLAGSLVAERAVTASGETRTYQHTDALGTPVAATDAARNIVTDSVERMTAYGEPADGQYADGPGYTGHVTDAASRLSYMQQRYYDPVVGRFLSVDPMASDTQNGWNFNRYNYGANNPYKFKDPDGRDIIFAVDPAQGGGHGHTTMYYQTSEGDWFRYDQGPLEDLPGGIDNIRSVQGEVKITAANADQLPADGVRIATTSQEDGDIAAGAIVSALNHADGTVKYNVLSNNCTDAAVDVVNSATNLNVPNPATTPRPNDWIEEIRENYQESGDP